MRKSRKLKRRSCPLCKPHKMGWEVRWKKTEFADRIRSDREMREAVRVRP